MGLGRPTSPTLTPRLAAIADLVPAGLAMADIGTDHGRLPAFLVASGRVPRAVGVDNKPGPLAVAQALGKRLALGPALEYRLGTGCEGLRDIGTLTIAGMGGTLIARILAGAGATGATQLVLQPNNAEAGLRGWLAMNGWAITTEVVVIDRGRRFAVIAATEGATLDSDPIDLAYGSPSKHRDLAALAALLDHEEARLGGVLAHHGGPGAEASIHAQLAIVRAARDRPRSR